MAEEQPNCLLIDTVPRDKKGRMQKSTHRSWEDVNHNLKVGKSCLGFFSLFLTRWKPLSDSIEVFAAFRSGPENDTCIEQWTGGNASWNTFVDLNAEEAAEQMFYDIDSELHPTEIFETERITTHLPCTQNKSVAR